mmetsp:Transcript_12234/g.22699  ORF Transcript_12234/g.22699 Transcript_12234/m.22699 type:complete len:110 (+) Transcript_12234:1472-1801(+)
MTSRAPAFMLRFVLVEELTPMPCSAISGSWKVARDESRRTLTTKPLTVSQSTREEHGFSARVQWKVEVSEAVLEVLEDGASCRAGRVPRIHSCGRAQSSCKPCAFFDGI